MAAPNRVDYSGKQNHSRTHDCTWSVCDRTLGSVRIGLTLDELERSHLCLQADPVRQRSEPAPFESLLL